MGRKTLRPRSHSLGDKHDTLVDYPPYFETLRRKHITKRKHDIRKVIHCVMREEHQQPIRVAIDAFMPHRSAKRLELTRIKPLHLLDVTAIKKLDY